MTNLRWIGGGRWFVRVVVVGFVAVGLMAASVVDIDGDPTTTNVATVVMSDEVPVAALDAARHPPPEPAARLGANPLPRLRRAVGRWLAEGRYRWIARVRPIRGP